MVAALRTFALFNLSSFHRSLTSLIPLLIAQSLSAFFARLRGKLGWRAGRAKILEADGRSADAEEDAEDKISVFRWPVAVPAEEGVAAICSGEREAEAPLAAAAAATSVEAATAESDTGEVEAATAEAPDTNSTLPGHIGIRYCRLPCKVVRCTERALGDDHYQGWCGLGGGKRYSVLDRYLSDSVEAVRDVLPGLLQQESPSNSVDLE